MNIKGEHSVDSIHKKLGNVMWELVGMAREADGLRESIDKLKEIKKDFWSNVRIPGSKDTLNMELEKALRLADFIEIGELMAHDALDRKSSAATSGWNTNGRREALRHDDELRCFCWEYKGAKMRRHVQGGA